MPWNMQFFQEICVLELSLMFADVCCSGHFTYSVLSKNCFCASVTRRKVHLSYFSLSTLSQHVILLMNRTEVISEQISISPSQHNAPDLHPFARKIEYKNQLEKKLRDKLTYYFRMYRSSLSFRMHNIWRLS